MKVTSAEMIEISAGSYRRGIEEADVAVLEESGHLRGENEYLKVANKGFQKMQSTLTKRINELGEALKVQGALVNTLKSEVNEWAHEAGHGSIYSQEDV